MTLVHYGYKPTKDEGLHLDDHGCLLDAWDSPIDWQDDCPIHNPDYEAWAEQQAAKRAIRKSIRRHWAKISKRTQDWRLL